MKAGKETMQPDVITTHSQPGQVIHSNANHIRMDVNLIESTVEMCPADHTV